MADATWPVGLPSDRGPLIGFSEEIQDNVIRTQMDTGPGKVRRRFTYAPSHYTMRFVFNTADTATFKAFFNTTLLSGVRTFDGLNNPRTGANATWRFLEPPTINNISNTDYEVNVKLEEISS